MSASPRSIGATMRSNHVGSSTLTSVIARTSAFAIRTASFRPRDRFPETTAHRNGSEVFAAKSRRRSAVRSVEPPSVTTTTSGRAIRDMRAGADFVLLSNPDIVVPPETIGRMVGLAESDPRIGFVGPVQRRTDTKGVRSAGVRWRCGRLPEHVLVPGEPIDAVEGAFVLIRREVFDKVGLLDEAFAINLEDIDFQLRARQHGYRSAIAADAEILHEPPGTTRRLKGAYYQTRNALILTSRYCGSVPLIRLKVRLYLEGISGKMLGRPRATYVLEGLRDFRQGVAGIKKFS